MSQSEAQRQVVRVLGGGLGAVSFEGSVQIQEKGGSKLAALSPSKCDMVDLEAGSEVVRGYHVPSGTHLVVPVDEVDPESDHWAADYV